MNTRYNFTVKAVLSHKTDRSIATSQYERQHVVRAPPEKRGSAGGQDCTPQGHETPNTYLRLNFDDNTGDGGGTLANKNGSRAPDRST